ncbi:MAG: hypothetical protein ACTSX4_09570 [Candidatus Helarchaeota archaeon]
MIILDKVTDEKVIKNLKIIRDYFMANARDVTKNVTNFLKTQDTIMKLDTAFDLIVGPQEEVKANKYLDIILSCAVEYIQDNSKLDELVERNLKQYLKYETVSSNMKKRHAKFAELEPLAKLLFRSRIITYARLLEGEGDDYFEISRSAYPSKEESLKRAKEEIELERKMADIIKENRSMIMAPGIMKIEVLEATLFTFDYIHEKILKEIDSIYGK